MSVTGEKIIAEKARSKGSRLPFQSRAPWNFGKFSRKKAFFEQTESRKVLFELFAL